MLLRVHGGGGVRTSVLLLCSSRVNKYKSSRTRSHGQRIRAVLFSLIRSILHNRIQGLVYLFYLTKLVPWNEVSCVRGPNNPMGYFITYPSLSTALFPHLVATYYIVHIHRISIFLTCIKQFCIPEPLGVTVAAAHEAKFTMRGCAWQITVVCVCRKKIRKAC